MRRLTAALVVLVSTAAPTPAAAWGFEGHRFVMDRAIALLPTEIPIEGEEFGGRFWLLDALVELCPLAHETESVRLSGCVGQSAGRLSVTGFGFDENDEEPGLDLVLTAGVSTFLMVAKPFGVTLGLGAGFPLSRNSYSARTAEGAVEVWQRGYVVGTGEIGVGLEL